jgi:hypothetical protein
MMMTKANRILMMDSTIHQNSLPVLLIPFRKPICYSADLNRLCMDKQGALRKEFAETQSKMRMPKSIM